MNKYYGPGWIRENENRNKNPFIYDNLVRKPEIEEEIEIQKPEIKQYIRQSIQRKKRNLNIFQLIYGIIYSIIILFIACSFIGAEVKLTTTLANIEKLEHQLEILKNENDTLEASINNNINLDEIKKDAMTRLGMVYPTKNQVIKYDKSEPEYVIQNQSIPNRK